MSEFHTTSWGLVLTARTADTVRSRDAMSALCQAYWKPLYSFVRRQGHSADEAADLTQAYFARVLEKNFFEEANPEVGRFRTFLLTSLKNFIANERRRERAVKRGGGAPQLSLDVEAVERQYNQNRADELTPEKLYEKRWALTVLERALERVREYYAREGKAFVFEQIKPFLTATDPTISQQQVASNLDMRTPAVRMAVHRARRRFRKALRDEVAETVAGPDEVDAELKHLVAALKP